MIPERNTRDFRSPQPSNRGRKLSTHKSKKGLHNSPDPLINLYATAKRQIYQNSDTLNIINKANATIADHKSLRKNDSSQQFHMLKTHVKVSGLGTTSNDFGGMVTRGATFSTIQGHLEN